VVLQSLDGFGITCWRALTERCRHKSSRQDESQRGHNGCSGSTVHPGVAHRDRSGLGFDVGLPSRRYSCASHARTPRCLRRGVDRTVDIPGKEIIGIRRLRTLPSANCAEVRERFLCGKMSASGRHFTIKLSPQETFRGMVLWDSAARAVSRDYRAVLMSYNVKCRNAVNSIVCVGDLSCAESLKLSGDKITVQKADHVCAVTQ